MARPTSLSMHIAEKLARRGARSWPASLGVMFPFDLCRRQRYRASALLFSLCCCSTPKFQSSRSFTTFLKNFTYSISSKSVGAASLIQQREGLLAQPRQAVENPPYVGRISPFTEPQVTPTEAACKFGGVYFSIECPVRSQRPSRYPISASALQLAR
ncbi:hypothetical protein NA56DRAFT_460736 [Hyaloscypha hepaticicola]|uniref:Uncharacterized protein n=1 Tax=Hyaloscypha hepaticicola TaxID=2082293 RepID=A0A2J6QF27_9HELO|nr:hypothetical protein NA56DRAFT_460736 [Hyaloscypha hepaticicola]